MTSFYFNPFAIPVLVSCMIMVVLALLLGRRYYSVHTRYVIWLFVVNAIYSFFYAMEISVTSIELIRWFYRIEYVGIPFLTTFYLMFVLVYTGRSKLLTQKIRFILFSIPVLTLILVFFNEYLHLFYKSEAIDYSGFFPFFSFVPGFWYWIQQAYVIVTMAFAFFYMVRMTINTASIYKRQVLFLMVSTLFPFVGYLLYQTKVIPKGIDPVSFTFTFTGLIVFFALVRLKLFNLIPVARTILFERTKDGVLVFDIEKRLIDFNHAAGQLFGLSRGDLGKTQEELPGLWQELKHKITSEFYGNFDYSHLDGDEEVFYDIQFLILEDENKLKQGKLVVCKDISIHILAERARKTATSRLNAIVHAMPDMMFVMDSDGILTDFFASDHNMLYLKENEIVGSRITQVFSEAESNILLQMIGECLETGQLKTYQYEMNIVDTLRHFEARISKLDESSVVIIVRDLTESLEMKRDLFYQSGFQVILMNLAAKFIYVPENEADRVIDDALMQVGEFCGIDRISIFSYNCDLTTMTNTHEWTRPGVVSLMVTRKDLPMESIPDWIESHQKGESTVQHDITTLVEDHPVRRIFEPAGVNANITIPRISEKNCLGFVGFDCELSSKKWNESELSLLKIFTGLLANLQEKTLIEKSLVEARIKAEAGNRLKTAFMNNISHEIRTPLNGIIGFGEIIANDLLSLEEKNQFLGVVQASSERLIQTIDDYMDISLLVTGNQELNNKSFVLADLLIEAMDSFAKACNQKNIYLLAEIPDEVRKRTIFTDPDMVKKILNHLIGNAMKFTKEGTIKISLSFSSDRFSVSVSDTGIGISAEAQQFIFDSFIQEDFSSTRGYEGSGLGLAIVKGIVSLMGGEISVKSNKGVGSTFQFTIPLNKNNGMNYTSE